jgi:hypothetical protein
LYNRLYKLGDSIGAYVLKSNNIQKETQVGSSSGIHFRSSGSPKETERHIIPNRSIFYQRIFSLEYRINFDPRFLKEKSISMTADQTADSIFVKEQHTRR